MFQRSRARTARLAIIGLAAAMGAGGLAFPAQADTVLNQYTATPLVTDATGAPNVDPALVNAWGMSQGPSSPVWVSNNGTATSTLYVHGASPKIPLTVAIPDGKPTGQVFNGTSGFPITVADVTAPARFIFASETGKLTAWNGGTSAVITKSVEGAAYKGLAIATSDNGTTRLYAANFAQGRVDVFGANWDRLNWPNAFRDWNLPEGYSPFGIQTLGNRVYVSYALRNPESGDDVSGAGHGFIDVFSTGGSLVKRLVSGGVLDSPWAMVMAPAGWGAFGGDLLVGNFGDGKIHAYDNSGHLVGTMRHGDADLVLDGLWGLLFGNGRSAATNELMFTSGPDHEAHGLWGVITVGADS